MNPPDAKINAFLDNIDLPRPNDEKNNSYGLTYLHGWNIFQHITNKKHQGPDDVYQVLQRLLDNAGTHIL